MPPRSPPAQAAAVAVALVVLGGGCGAAQTPSTPPPPPSVPETCGTRLPPRQTEASAAAAPRPAPSFTAPRSTLVVHADVPLGGVKEQLEAKVGTRVAEQRDVDIGVAGRLEYTVDRGPFRVRADAGALVVEVPLRGRARACAKGSCYAGCDPEGIASVRVPIHLDADYKLRAGSVRVDVTRGCEVRVLGGFVKVDVTPMLRARLSAETQHLKAAIDRELPDLSSQAARLWSELARPRALPLGGCLLLAPEELTQGPAVVSAEAARLRFGLLARPEIRLRCGEAAPAPRGLPRLRDDPALPEAADVHLAMVMPADAPSRAIAGAVMDLGRGRARVRDARGDVLAGLDLELAGEICGDGAITAESAAWTDARSVHLAGVLLRGTDVPRFASSSVDAAAFARAVEAVAIPVPVAADAVSGLLSPLADGLSDDRVAVGVQAEPSRAETAGLRGAEIVAVVALRAVVNVRPRVRPF